MYHIFFHSPVNGHLDCFNVLALVECCNNNGLHVSFQIVGFFDINLGMKLLSHMAALFLVF